MSRSNTHAILGELHRLLGNYRAADFLDASNYGGVSSHLRQALRELAREVEPVQRITDRERGNVKEKTQAQGDKRIRKADLRKPDILHLIHGSSHFTSNASLISYARSIGLRLSTRPKEGKEKLARRIAHSIEEFPESKQKEIVADLRRTRDNQTQGWLEVIRGLNNERIAPRSNQN